MRGIAVRAELTAEWQARDVDENRDAANKGGRIAGEAREKLEEESGRKVVSEENYLEVPERQKRMEHKNGAQP